MPSQSGDPVSSALQASLSGCSKKEEDISLLLSYSAKQVLLSQVKCEEFTYDSTAFLKDLKSKYTVISPGHEEPRKVQTCDKIKGEVKERERSEAKCNGSGGPSLPTPSRTLWPPDAVSLGWKPNTPVGGGFINLWNSCYINSTLQALFHIPGFVNWLLTDNSHKCINKNGSLDCLICSMAQTLRSSQECTGKAIKPCLIYSRLKSICKHLNPGTQEDAHEFLRHLVDSLDKTYLTPFKDLRLDHLSKETTPLSQIFGGYLRNEVVCQSCRHVSTTFQYFQDLPLDIASASNIDQALDLYFSRESVSEQEGYRCENCKKRVPFIKKFSLEKAPRVLCLQLKRFGAVSGKNNKSISIASKLHLNKYKAVKNGVNFEPYQLAAVVNHVGTSASCGHYTAIAMAADNRYYLFDDQRVERLHDLSPNSSQAYILLYHQKPIVPNGVKTTVFTTKLVSNNSVLKNLFPSSVPQESAKERIFGKSNDPNLGSKNPLKLFGNSVLAKVNSTVNTLSNAFKVNGTGGGASGSKESKDKAGASDEEVVAEAKGDEAARLRDGEASQEEEGKRSAPCKNPKEERRIPEEDPDQRWSCDSSPRPAASESSKHNGTSPTKSLVPYNESSSSSSLDDSSSSEWGGSRPPSPGGSPPKRQRLDAEHRCEEGSASGSAAASPQAQGATNGTTPEKNGTSPSAHRLNGRPSPPKQRYSNGNANNIGQNFGKHPGGKWFVSTKPPNSSPEKMESSTNNWSVRAEPEGQNNFKNHLSSMSHRGYGKPVMTWSGDVSEMEKEVRNHNHMNQRNLNYDNYDSPRRKMKRYDGHKTYEGKDKRFNDAQRRQNWYNSGYRRHNGFHRRDSAGDGYRTWHKFKPWNMT